MKLFSEKLSALIVFILLGACSTEQTQVEKKTPQQAAVSSNEINYFSAPITELSDEEYPHNTDLGNMSSNYHELSHDSVKITRKPNGMFEFIISPANPVSDTITFPEIDIKVYIPALPEWIKKDTFLTEFGYTNAEWNRHQVRYDREKDYFKIKGGGYESQKIIRIDIARNCLNAGLWELIFYSQEDGKSVPCYHGWFMFPENLYGELFETINGEKYEVYKPRMAGWIDPENKLINFDLLRTVKSENEIKFTSLNDQMYPLTGARVSKRKNIIYPKDAKSINDFLNDSTRFATFAPPGIYTRSDPRRTQLSKLAFPKVITLRSIVQKEVNPEKELTEFEIEYSNRSGNETTYLILGGLSLDQMPKLSLPDNNSGYKMPMGIANHHFYETYEKAQNNPSKQNPYYGLLVDKNKKCLDSHAVGIDGPIIFWDADDEGLLHILLLSFERHAFVGHITLRPNLLNQ